MITQDADTTKPSPVSSTDFLLNRENILGLLSRPNFFNVCPGFIKIKDHVKQLSEFIKENVNTSDGKKCSNCAKARALRGQMQIVDNFVKIFVWLHNTGKIKELSDLKEFINASKTYRRIVLAYSGPATNKKPVYIVLE